MLVTSLSRTISGPGTVDHDHMNNKLHQASSWSGTDDFVPLTDQMIFLHPLH